jgi:hypothetical protein
MSLGFYSNLLVWISAAFLSKRVHLLVMPKVKINYSLEEVP